MNMALILAGGRGRRFGGPLPKQYAEVLGKPVLAHTMEVFEQAPGIDAVAAVCQPEHAERIWRIARQWNLSKLRYIFPGGDTCQDSIRSGVYSLRPHLKDSDLLTLHTGVSPLVDAQTLAASLRQCAEKGCSFTMYPLLISLARRMGEDWTDRNALRREFVELNVPWSFRYGELYRLYREADRLGLGKGPEDYALDLWLETGRRAWFIPGRDPGRLKITTRHDLDLFEGYLRLMERRKAERTKNEE